MEAPTSKDKNEKSKIAPIENKAFNLNSSSILLNNPLDFSIIENPLEELAESKSAIIHIKNTLKNSVFNCYVNCCCGHSVIFNTFLNTPKGIKYLFQSNASINPDLYNCTFKDNIRLEARFTSLTKKNSEEISLDTGNPFTEMLKKEKSCCFDMEEILMPVNIIAENRIAGIVKIHGFPAEKCCSNKACLCLFCCMVPSLIYLSCPFCSSCQCGDCCNSDNKSSGCCKCDCCNSDKKCPCCDENRCCCGLCEKSSCPCCDENRCCCGLCPKSDCGCCTGFDCTKCCSNDPNRCCCAICLKTNCCYCDDNRCCCGICLKPNCCCCAPNRCCCGLCPKPNCACCDDNRSCCGLCEKSNSSCCCCCCCSCNGVSMNTTQSPIPNPQIINFDLFFI